MAQMFKALTAGLNEDNKIAEHDYQTHLLFYYATRYSNT
jgi:hypothetical protein